jgi:hypothetical protein
MPGLIAIIIQADLNSSVSPRIIAAKALIARALLITLGVGGHFGPV